MLHNPETSPEDWDTLPWFSQTHTTTYTGKHNPQHTFIPTTYRFVPKLTDILIISSIATQYSVYKTKKGDTVYIFTPEHLVLLLGSTL